MNAKEIEKRAQELLRHAKRQSKTAETWQDLSNAIYGIGGKASQLFPTPPDRDALVGRPEYKEIAELIGGLPGRKLGVAKPDEPSGKILVRVPKSVHAALLEEAAAEGVSLNQLILAKLSFQLRA